MASFKTVMKSGHPPTLFAAFLYFDFCFAIWVLNGAMGPFITETYKLTPAQTGFMISLPILAGALMRFPLGILAQYIGRKNAAITEMSVIILAMAYGYLFVSSYNDVLAMGVLLGIAGASFGVALSLGSGWFPPEHKGLAMGIAGAGNSGTVLAVLFAPPLAQAYGWQTTYAFAGVVMLLPLAVMIVLAKEPPDCEHQSFKEHISCLFTKDGWAFSLIYVITFGGFVGLSNFLPTFFYEQFAVTKVEAGRLTMLAAFMGSGIRIVGGYFADRMGGIAVLSVVLLAAIATFLSLTATPSLALTTILFMLCFAALGAGNGALFQLVPAALAEQHRSGRLDDRRGRCARRRDPAERHGPVEAVYRLVLDGLHRLRGLHGGRARLPGALAAQVGRKLGRTARQGARRAPPRPERTSSGPPRPEPASRRRRSTL